MGKFLYLFTAIVFSFSCKQREGSSCPAPQGLTANEMTGASLASKKISLSIEDISGDSWHEISLFLQAFNIKATYFISGTQASDQQSRANTLASQGHLISSRGWTGQDLASAPDPVSEVRRGDFAISQLVTTNLYFLRSSGGWNSEVANELNSSGLGKYIGSIGMDIGWKSAGFNDDLSCWTNRTPVATCADGYLEELKRIGHGIINFRSSEPKSFQLLKILIPQLTSEGFSFVRIDEIPDISARIAAIRSAGGPSASQVCDEYK